MNAFPGWFEVVRLFLVAFAVVTGARSQISETLWHRVAAAPIIAVGTLKVPVKEMEEHQANSRHDYVDLCLDDAEFLKGSAARSFIIRWYTEPHSYSPSLGTLAGLNGRKVVVFTVRTAGNRSAICFAGDTPDAVTAANPVFLGQVRSEIAEQHKLVAQFPKGLTPVGKKEIEIIRQLLDETTVRGKAETAFEKLLELGADYVPAIVLLMDDRRHVSAEWLKISNAPSHWEAYALYKPEKVVDALDGILVKTTGVSFVRIVNGNSDENRRATVDAWRVWLYHRQLDSISAKLNGS